MTDLLHVRAALAALQDREDGPVGLSLAIAPPSSGIAAAGDAGSVQGWGGADPHPVGDRLTAVLVAATAVALCGRGLLSASTTICECVPVADTPPGVDRTQSIEDLLGVLGHALAAPAGRWQGATTVDLLARMAAAACGEPLAEVVGWSVLAATGMPSTTAHALGTGVRLTTTADDLRRFATSSAWDGLTSWDVLPAAGGEGRRGVGGDPEGTQVWRYAGCSLAFVGGATPALAVLDALLSPVASAG